MKYACAEVSPLLTLAVVFCLTLGSPAQDVLDQDNADADRPVPARVLLPFRDPLSRRYGYMDTDRNVVVKPQFRYADFFDDGLARVELENSNYAFIHEDGSVAFRVRSNGLPRFSNGVAVVEVAGGYRFLDRTGQVLGRVGCTYAENFENGFSRVGVNRKVRGRASDLCGLMDPHGKWLVEPRFEDISRFSDGLAAARGNWRDEHRAKNEKWGFIDESGKYVIPPRFEEEPDRFSEGLAFVREGKLSGYIDKAGEKVIQGTFHGGLEFSEGLAPVESDNGLRRVWGYIDRTGKFVIDPSYEYARPFHDGIAAVQYHGRWGFIASSGEFAVKPQFERVEDFRNGVARVIFFGGDFGYIIRPGRLLLAPRQAMPAQPALVDDGLLDLTADEVTKRMGKPDSKDSFALRNARFHRGGLPHIIAPGKEGVVVDEWTFKINKDVLFVWIARINDQDVVIQSFLMKEGVEF